MGGEYAVIGVLAMMLAGVLLFSQGLFSLNAIIIVLGLLFLGIPMLIVFIILKKDEKEKQNSEGSE